MKILFITDSLGFPRAEPEFVGYDDTYLARLKTRFPDCDFIHQGRGGATIVDLFKHSAYFHKTIAPDLVFVQAGVVDCAPRALSVVEQQVISRLPVIGGLLARAVKRHAPMMRRVRQMTYTPLPVFADYMHRFEELFSPVYWIGILPVSAEYESKLEGMQRSSDAYNAVLRTGRFVDTAGLDPATMIMTDHHHLNAAGHARMADILADTICAYLSARRAPGASPGEPARLRHNAHAN
ncbi:SGNH/GDSL hydrolase family protein [Massilia agilis]|uniref:SGNH/GDSL hydrolase family protein n=1 Tax=Massilia agilis TaxID=1811226 RepID=A0ABT2D9B3_9BURK|nr:SGNH/GDSL hydrolase family protein [Massilia agilis]MCS0807439.1 SGNH/GDSL hydrolase family protein [Massilia agilis]